MSLAAGALVLALSGCVIEPMRVAYQPPPVEIAPAIEVAPAVAAPAVLVPEMYVWDGSVNIGIVGGSYVYLGSGNVWCLCEPWRVDRFHRWEFSHRDWRDHATRNELYRADIHGQRVEPRGGGNSGGSARVEPGNTGPKPQVVPGGQKVPPPPPKTPKVVVKDKNNH